MFTNAKLALCVAAVLGSTSAAQTAPQRPTIRQTESIAQNQVSRSASGDDSFAPAPGQSTRANAVYFDPSPAPFNAFTYCASVLLTPSTSKRVVQGEFRFPAFRATPNVRLIDRSRADAGPRAQNSGNPRDLGRHQNANRR